MPYIAALLGLGLIVWILMKIGSRRVPDENMRKDERRGRRPIVRIDPENQGISIYDDKSGIAKKQQTEINRKSDALNALIKNPDLKQNKE